MTSFNDFIARKTVNPTTKRLEAIRVSKKEPLNLYDFLQSISFEAGLRSQLFGVELERAAGH